MAAFSEPESAAAPSPPAEEDTRRRIFDAAGPIFAERGFDKATVREICAAAGVNVASIGYHFGDKMGLYLEIVRQIRGRREQAFPLLDVEGPPAKRLFHQVHRMLQRILCMDDNSWETQLMMREMQHPTQAFRELVEQYFRPLFQRLRTTLREVSSDELTDKQLDRLTFSVVGQCVYYCVGGRVIDQLIPATEHDEYFDPDALAQHVTAQTLAALSGTTYGQQINDLESPTHD